MGFSNVIYKYPKFKDTDLDKIFSIEAYYSYDTNKWAKENFDSAKAYMDYNHGLEGYVAPTQEQLDYYKQFIHADEFRDVIIKDDVYYNCSAGRPFHEDIQEVLDLTYEECNDVELNKEDLIKLLNFEINKLDDYKFESAFVNNCFVNVESEDDEDADIVLKHCDGIEATFEDGSIKRFETNSDYASWGTLIMLPKGYVDEYEYNTQLQLVKTLSDLLVNTDFERDCLVYCGGW